MHIYNVINLFHSCLQFLIHVCQTPVLVEESVMYTPGQHMSASVHLGIPPVTLQVIMYRKA